MIRDYIVTTEIIGTRTWEVEASSPDEAFELVCFELAHGGMGRTAGYRFPEVGEVTSVQLVHDPDLDGSISPSEAAAAEVYLRQRKERD